jgi:hypothetical protein
VRDCGRYGPAVHARLMLVSGMIIGTMCTLFIVPSIYVLLARSRRVVAREAEAGVGVPALTEAS